MIFKIDENLPSDTAALLQEFGFGAHTVREEGLLGANDEVLADVARREGRVFVTLDRDFSNIRAYPPADHAGIVVRRPQTQDKLAVKGLLQRLISMLSSESPVGELWIVEPDRIRRRL